jgi:tRNA A-37 threonylcarbamoyl transferase component Bud32
MNAVTIKYGKQSTISRWYQNYWTETDRKVVPWLIVLILGFFLFYGPNFLLWLASFLPLDQLGNSGASIRSHIIIEIIALVFAAALSALVIRPLLKPNLLELLPTGLRRIWRFGFIAFKSNLLPWEKIISVQLTRGSDKIDLNSYDLCLNTTESSERVKLALSDLQGDAEREALMKALSAEAINAEIEPSVFDSLMPKRELSFTELWLSALTSAPNRERLLPLTDGTLLDNRYRIIKKLGAGGQGTVYLSEDQETKSEIVLKETILPVFADNISRKQTIEDFHKEAFALESVKHPNIVKFLGSFVCDHRAYLILEYIEGQTLKSKIENDGPCSPAQAVGFGKQMCEILSALHRLSPPLIHRDFTPDNLIIKENGQLVLLDFAVAVAGGRASAEVAGKASYMAPEQFKGVPTVQSDLYSAGCTVHFCLTAENPDPITECHPILVNGDVTRNLNDVVAHATKYDAALRFRDANEFKVALEEVDGSKDL